jgi:ABC-type sugar transport system ATPase subunit
MIPEDRRRHGLNLIQSVGENISLVAHRHVLNSLLIKHRRLRKIISEMIKLLAIKTPSVETKVETLSGGNQQKVVLGKWLTVKPKILIMDEPTRGIDVGTKYEIYKLMHQMNAEGVSIIMVDSDLEELLGMSDRVIIINRGRVAGELAGREISAEAVMHLAV